MAQVPEDLRYTREHEWAKVEGKTVRVGITAFAQEQLGDVVFVELPKVGTRIAQMQAFGVVESVKAVSDLFAPLGGEVIEINTALAKAPELVNQDPYGTGWMVIITPQQMNELDGLMSAKDYETFVAGAAH
jgi:glycine cleavage system H protein